MRGNSNTTGSFADSLVKYYYYLLSIIWMAPKVSNCKDYVYKQTLFISNALQIKKVDNLRGNSNNTWHVSDSFHP